MSRGVAVAAVAHLGERRLAVVCIRQLRRVDAHLHALTRVVRAAAVLRVAAAGRPRGKRAAANRDRHVGEGDVGERDGAEP